MMNRTLLKTHRNHRWWQVTAAALCCLGALAIVGCPGKRPTDETPDGALTLFLEAMKRGDRNEAYRLLSPENQRELGVRASTASKQAGRTLEPSEMLVVDRFVTRWEISRMTAEVEGDSAVVTATGGDEDQRALVQMQKAEGRWRVILPLGDDPAP
jgi:hypothetical protein